MQPGQPGPQGLLQRYGKQLVCVRSREDASGRRRYTTVELLVDEAPMRHRNDGRALVAVEIPGGAGQQRQRAIELGARWDPEIGLWRMSWQTAQALGLAGKAQTRRPR